MLLAMISDFFQVLFEIAYNRVHFLTYGNPAFLVYAGVVLVSLVLWRLWRFTILPATRPNEPKELPYWVPGNRKPCTIRVWITNALRK